MPSAVISDLDQLWAAMIEAVGRARPMIKGYFAQAFPLAFAKNLLTVGFDPEFADQMDLVNSPANVTLLQTKLAELGHHGVAIKFAKAERPTGSTPLPAAPAPVVVPEPAPRPAATITSAASSSAAPAKVKKPAGNAAPAPVKLTEADFKNDPLIQKALEEFKGHIVNAGG